MWLNRLKDVFYLSAIVTLGWMVFFNKPENKKIAFIDVKKVFDGFELKKELQKKYQGQMAGKKKLIDSLGFEVQQLGIELESSKTPDQTKTEIFIQKRKQYMELVKIYDGEDQKVNSEYDAQILTQMNQFVKDYGDENGYDMILGSLGNGTIMHANSEMDISDKVLKFINKKYAGDN